MIGFNLCFMGMHVMGMFGLPRRVCVYEPCFQGLNSVSRIGGIFSVFSGFFLLYIL